MSGRGRPGAYVLGVSALYHDGAACLLRDGEIVAAAQEERFSRRKHDPALPTRAVASCLARAGIGPEDLDHVVFYEKPLRKLDRLLETWLAFAPRGLSQFRLALPALWSDKLRIPRALDRMLDGRYQGRFVFVEHHESHAASAFFPSPFEEAAILTLDGVGEWATATLGTGRGNRLELTHEQRFPHSLGLLYSAFTYFTGFAVNSGEYKMMGLAPYGEPVYVDRILDEVVDLKGDGSLRLDLSCFAYCTSDVMTSRRFEALFGGPPRRPESPLTQREMDLAASIQAVTEEAILRSARHLHRVTGLRRLVLAGGVALNCVANGRLLREGPFDELWIQPAAGDAGGALGAALFLWHQLRGEPRPPAEGDQQQGSLLGPSFSEEEARAALDGLGATYERLADEDAVQEAVAGLVADGLVVGHVDGPMEYGPRALGNRSILADARSPEMQSVLNRKIKFRESFRPFAPVVLRERVHEWFDTPEELDSPYMLLVAGVREARRTDAGDAGLRGLDRLSAARSQVPAVTHVDGSARMQTVDAGRHPRLHGILRRFEAETGCPVMINTSFNVRGEPIVCTPADAYRCFLATNMDVLVVGRLLLRKERQPGAREWPDAGHLTHIPPD